MHLMLASLVCVVLAACTALNTAKKKLTDAPECCKDVSALPYQKIDFGQRELFSIDEQSPVFQFPTTKGYFRAFSLPVTDNLYSVTLRSHLTNADVTVLASRVFCPVVMLLDANYKIRADYLRPIAFNNAGETTRSIPLTIPLTPMDRYLVVHTEDVLIGRKMSLDLGPASPTFDLVVGNVIVPVPKPETVLDPETEYRVHHLVPCAYTGSMEIEISLPE